MDVNMFCTLLISILTVLLLRMVYLIYVILTQECRLVKGISLRTMICIGSGGHTTEMLRLMRSLNLTKYSPRFYVAADNDVSSEVKIHQLEEDSYSMSYKIVRIPRSRNVNQSYLSSVITTILAILYTVPVLYRHKPDVIFCNGPGTCVPICVVAFLMRCCFILDCRIVFVESVCRVRTMSLTGKILQYIADIIIVQWPHLKDVCFRAKCLGRLT